MRFPNDNLNAGIWIVCGIAGPLVFGLWLVITAGPIVPPSQDILSIRQILEQTTADRQEHGYEPLTLDQELSAAARAKLADMVARDYFAHVSPDGETIWPLIEKAGYCYVYAGENLAGDFLDEEEQQQAWMDSPTHRANILSPFYEDIGLAVSQEPLLAVAVFGVKCG